MGSYPTPSRGNKLTISFGLVNVGVKYSLRWSTRRVAV